MSGRVHEFPQVLTSAGQARSHRPDRHPKRNSALLVAQPGPRAQREDVLLLGLQPVDDLQHASHLIFVRETSDQFVGEVLRHASVQPPESTLGATPGTSAVAENIHSHAEEPRKALSRFCCKLDILSSSPSHEKHLGHEVFRLRPVRRPAKAKVVDRSRVPLVEIAKCVRIALADAFPKLGV
jgi:hypothetical protein